MLTALRASIFELKQNVKGRSCFFVITKYMKVTICKTPRWQLLKGQIQNLSPEAFKEKIATIEDAVLIDVRSPEEHAVNPLPNSLNINYLGAGFWEEMEKLDTSKAYLIYCRTGRRSLRACTLMKNGGFDHAKVFNLDGGMVAWEEVFGY